jgi:hypothetical protein
MYADGFHNLSCHFCKKEFVVFALSSKITYEFVKII